MTKQEIKEWNDSVWAPHCLEVAEVDILADASMYPDIFLGGIDPAVSNFVKETGRLPHEPEELDVFEGEGEKEWEAYCTSHGLSGLLPR